MDAIFEFFTGCVPAAYALVMFFAGAAVGSFLNVVICRMPHGLSLLSPPSACPQCGKRIFGLDNLPILSWFLLRGCCRRCKQPISFRYPAVEILNALLWAAIAWTHAELPYGPYTNAGLLLAQLLFTSSLVAVVFIDFDHQIIPDEISLGGLVAALVLSGVLPELHIPHHPTLIQQHFPSVAPWAQGLLCGFLGAAVGGGLLYVLRAIGSLAFRKQIRKAQEEDPEVDSAIGLGDVKLMAFVGAFLGWKAILAGFFLGTLIGAVAGSVDKLRTGSWPSAGDPDPPSSALSSLAHRWETGVSIMPYGPFLAVGSLILLLFRKPVIGWFVELFAVPGA
jgi:leader peptidase (prepilin peptidase) / N-methyltransferase